MTKKYALVVGVSDYSDTKLDQVVASAQDATAVGNLLKESGDFEVVTVLINSTISQIREELEKFADEKKRDDLLLFYFSGHSIRDDFGRLYLAAKDTRYNHLLSTALSAQFIQAIFEATRSKINVVILDTSYSGAFAIDFGQKDSAVLTSCASEQYSYLTNDKKHSIFTKYLIEGIKSYKADTNQDGFISISEVYEYTSLQLAKEGGKQKPVLKSSYISGGDIILIQAPQVKKPTTGLTKNAELAIRIEETLSQTGNLPQSTSKDLDKAFEKDVPVSIQLVLLQSLLRNYRQIKKKGRFQTDQTPSLKNSLQNPATLNKIKRVLLYSEQFENNRTVRSLFLAPELRPFASGIPEAQSVSERIDFTVSYLTARRLSDGRPALIVLLNVLESRFDDADERKKEVQKLLQELTYNEKDSLENQPSIFYVNNVLQSLALNADKSIQFRLIEWIIEEYNDLDNQFDIVLQKLVLDSDIDVRQKTITTIRSYFDLLPQSIRSLATQLPILPLTVYLVKGSGMLVNRSNELTIRIHNQSEQTVNGIEVEIIQPSAEYIVIGQNTDKIAELLPDKHQDISFQIQVKVKRQIAVNYKINGELREPPLYISAIGDNPYIYGDPVREELAFFGRQDELDQIIQAITKPVKQDILIVGERRTGKTSIFYRVIEQLKPPFVPVYVVLSSSTDGDSDGNSEGNSILNLILREIINALAERALINAEELDNSAYFDDSRPLSERVNMILSHAKKRVQDVKLVLLLDEADYLLRISRPPRSFLETLKYFYLSLRRNSIIDERPQNILRAVLQSEKVGQYLRAVVAGTSDLSRYISQHTSPFFNHFRLVRLKPLSITETKDLIIKPAASLGYNYAELAVQEIVDLSGGQPYYCQALCYEAFQHALARNSITVDKIDVAKAETKITEDLFDPFLSGFWARANRSEKAILRKLAVSDESPSEMSTDLKRLVDWQLINETPQGFIFASGLVKKWVQLAIRRP
jgi:AAA+ ATPase superfamily predicted ATPase